VDELFELLTLMQTEKLRRCPVVLVGEAYWAGLYDWLVTETLAHGYISEHDLEFLQLAPDAGTALTVLLDYYEEVREELGRLGSVS